MNTINFISFINLIIHAGWFGDKTLTNVAVYLDNELYIGFSYFSGRWLSNINASKIISNTTGIDIFPAICTGINIINGNTLSFCFKSADTTANANKDVTLGDIKSMLQTSATDMSFFIMPNNIPLNSFIALDIFSNPVAHIEIEGKTINLSYKDK